MVTFVDFSQCSGSDFGVRFPGRCDSHLCGLTSNLIAVKGFGDILTIFYNGKLKIEGFCEKLDTGGGF